MRSFRAKPVGWQYESHRHRLAAQGISTNRYMMAKGYMMKRSRPGLVGRVHKIPIVAQKLPQGEVYPISPKEVKATVGSMKPENVQGITAIEFVQAKTGEQKGAWAQYLRGKRKLLIFSQKASKDGDRIDGVSAKTVSDHMKTYVLPHEIGHHIALYKKRITDKDIKTAEARADAHVVGMAADDRDVNRLKAYMAAKHTGLTPQDREFLEFKHGELAEDEPEEVTVAQANIVPSQVTKAPEDSKPAPPVNPVTMKDLKEARQKAIRRELAELTSQERMRRRHSAKLFEPYSVKYVRTAKNAKGFESFTRLLKEEEMLRKQFLKKKVELEEQIQ